MLKFIKSLVKKNKYDSTSVQVDRARGKTLVRPMIR